MRFRRIASVDCAGGLPERDQTLIVADQINDLTELDRLLGKGAQLAEALPAEEYEEGHLPGAVSLPLKQLTAERAAVLDQGRPVIVYCWDSL